MKITIRKLQTMVGTDDVIVHCHVYANGKEIGIAHDDGNGGGIQFQLHPNDAPTRALLEKVEAYAAALPEIDLNTDKILGNDPNMFQPDLEWLIDEAINQKLIDQGDKKIEKQKKI